MARAVTGGSALSGGLARAAMRRHGTCLQRNKRKTEMNSSPRLKRRLECKCAGLDAAVREGRMPKNLEFRTSGIRPEPNVLRYAAIRTRMYRAKNISNPATIPVPLIRAVQRP